MIALVLILVSGLGMPKNGLKSLLRDGLAPHFCFFSSVREDGLHLLIPIRKKMEPFWAMQELYSLFLYVLYGIAICSPLFWRDGSSYLFKWLEKKRKLVHRDALAYGLGGTWGLEMPLLSRMEAWSVFLILFHHPVFKYRCSQSSSKAPHSKRSLFSVWHGLFTRKSVKACLGSPKLALYLTIKVSVKRNGLPPPAPMVCMPCLTWLQPYLKWRTKLPLVEFILLVELSFI